MLPVHVASATGVFSALMDTLFFDIPGHESWGPSYPRPIDLCVTHSAPGPAARWQGVA